MIRHWWVNEYPLLGSHVTMSNGKTGVGRYPTSGWHIWDHLASWWVIKETHIWTSTDGSLVVLPTFTQAENVQGDDRCVWSSVAASCSSTPLFQRRLKPRSRINKTDVFYGDDGEKIEATKILWWILLVDLVADGKLPPSRTGLWVNDARAILPYRWRM